MLEQEETELNENLISAQILASKLDRVYTLFQENLALSQLDSLAEDASLPFLNSLTDILDDLNIQLLGIKPKDRESRGEYYKSPYVIIHNKKHLNCKISISHDGKYAIAYALIEK